jgi:acyl-CoA dehydrogenase
MHYVPDFLCLHKSQFVVPMMAGKVVDRAMQSYGAAGVSQDTPLAKMAANLRTLRLADVSAYYFTKKVTRTRLGSR